MSDAPAVGHPEELLERARLRLQTIHGDPELFSGYRSLVSDLSEALTQSLERERNAVAAVAVKDSENPLVQALQEQVEALTAERDDARSAVTDALAIARMLTEELLRRSIAAATRREEALQEALRVIAGPEDRSPWLTPYQEAGGGYEGLQAIAKAALATTPEPPPAPERLERAERLLLKAQPFLMDTEAELQVSEAIAAYFAGSQG